MSDDSAFIRQWLLLRVLISRRSGSTIDELAREFNVSAKTIRRDFQSLTRVGFRLQESARPHGQKMWWIDESSILAGLTFTFEEVAVFYLFRRYAEPLAGTSFWSAAQSAFRKIRCGLSPGLLEYLGRLATVFHQTTFGTSDYSRRGEIIDSLLMAIEDSRTTVVRYESASAVRPECMTIHPLGMIFHRSSLYVVAFAPERDEIRHYKIDRMTAADVGSEHFARPVGFCLADHLDGSFGVFHKNQPLSHVRIRFSPDVAKYVEEHRWQPSQKLSRRDDGFVFAEFDVSTFEEIKSWILSFGGNAVVEEPKGLAQEILDEARRIADSYNKGEIQPRQKRKEKVCR